MVNKMHYVIIGNSASAVGCIEGIRSVDTEGKITVISDENHHVYGRPLISYMLMGKLKKEMIWYRPYSFYSDNKVDTLFGKKVIGVDAVQKEVRVDDGTTIKYDKLLIATGSMPFVPPFTGLEDVHSKYSFMTLDDALNLEKVLDKDKKVLIMGAGLIGLKCAEGILSRVKSVTVVDLADRILPSILDNEGSEIVKNYLERKGIKFYLSDTAEKFTADAASLKSGVKIPFDILVLAVGVRPNTELARTAGATIERGVLTDISNRTSVDDVYAAGDCAVSHDISSGTNRVIAIMPNAYIGGHNAGVNMAGGNETFKNAIPMNSIGFFGLHIITVGSYEGDTYIERTAKTYKKIFYKDNRMKGYIIIGDVARSGIYTSLVRNEIPLDTIDFDLICKQPQLMAFAAKDRDKLLNSGWKSGMIEHE
jgi:NAD(P)H-nitrite reductase large subunit